MKRAHAVLFTGFPQAPLQPFPPSHQRGFPNWSLIDLVEHPAIGWWWPRGLTLRNGPPEAGDQVIGLELFLFRGQFRSPHPFQSLPEDLPADFQPIADSFKILADFHRRRNRRPIVETINEVLNLTRSNAAFALRPAGYQVLGNVQRVCDLAQNFEVSGGMSFRGFVEYMEEEDEKPRSTEAPVLEE